MKTLALASRTLMMGVVATLTACGSPAPALYTIAPVEGHQYSPAPSVVLLEQVALERYLERSQIVRSSENYRLQVLSNDWWGEPLSAMLNRVLVTELGQRLPHSIVISELGAVSATPDATVALNIRRLDEDASGALVLLAQASVTFSGRSKPALRDFHITAVPPAAGTPGEVAAISIALGQMADQLADMIAKGRP